MVHYWNFVSSVQDCSRGTTYHNHRFKEAVVAHGLTVQHSDKYDWSHTAPSNALLDLVLDYGLTATGALEFV